MPATGNVVFTVTDNIEVDTGAILQRTDGVQLIVTSGGTLRIMRLCSSS